MYWATDEMLIYGDKSSNCGMPIPVWAVLISIALCLRFWLCVEHWRVWIVRERQKKHHMVLPLTAQRFERRIPVVPLVSTYVLVMQIIFLSLASANVISARDGTSSFVLALLFFGMQCVNQLFAFKLVRLGRRIAPLKGSGSGQKQGDDDFFVALTNFDQLQQILNAGWWCGAFGNCISPFLVYFLRPSPNGVAFRFLFISNLVMVIASIALQVHQISRVLLASEGQARKMAGVVSGNAMTSQIATAIQLQDDAKNHTVKVFLTIP